MNSKIISFLQTILGKETNICPQSNHFWNERNKQRILMPGKSKKRMSRNKKHSSEIIYNVDK